MVIKKKISDPLNGKVSVSMPVILNCIRLLRNKILTWTRHLPADLGFSALGGAVGYTETDPVVRLR